MRKTLMFLSAMLAAVVFEIIGCYVLAWPNLGLAATIAVVGAFLVQAMESKP
jgi:uncharacterized membrane protein HdeD (DUF308 family)